MTLDLRKTEYFHLEEEEEQKESGADFSEFANLYEREILTSKINDRFGNPIQQYDLFMTLFGVKMLDDKDEEANAQVWTSSMLLPHSVATFPSPLPHPTFGFARHQMALEEAAERAKKWSRNKKVRTDSSANWLRRTQRARRPQLAAGEQRRRPRSARPTIATPLPLIRPTTLSPPTARTRVRREAPHRARRVQEREHASSGLVDPPAAHDAQRRVREVEGDAAQPEA